MGNPQKNTVTTSEEFKALVRDTQNPWENEKNEGLDLSFRRSKTEEKKKSTKRNILLIRRHKTVKQF